MSNTARIVRTAIVPLLLASCGSTDPIGNELDLTGLWTVASEREAHVVDFGTTGAMTLEFAAPDGGQARFLGVDAASGVTRCRDYDATLHEGAVLALGPPSGGGAGWSFVVEPIDADTLTLSDELQRLTLTRVPGAGPVAACGTATVGDVVEVSVDRPFWTTLSAVDDTLYFNTGDGNPIVGYSLGADAVTSSRSFSGSDRTVAAAQDHDVFVGYCACGRSHEVTRFDLEAGTSLVQRHTGTHLGVQMIVRYGYALPGAVVIGGIEDADSIGSSVNLLATLDGTTLDLVAQRTILDGVTLADITVLGGHVVALTRDWEIVTVGPDGMALATHVASGASGTPLGIAAVGDDLYVLAVDDGSPDDLVTLVRLTLE